MGVSMVKFFKDSSGTKLWIEKIGEIFWIHINGRTIQWKSKKAKARLPKTPSNSEGGLELKSPHPGRISEVLVKKGDKAAAGQVLIKISAMKMEHSLKAQNSYFVKEVLVQPGQAVDFDTPLILFN